MVFYFNQVPDHKKEQGRLQKHEHRFWISLAPEIEKLSTHGREQQGENQKSRAYFTAERIVEKCKMSQQEQEGGYLE